MFQVLAVFQLGRFQNEVHLNAIRITCCCILSKSLCFILQAGFLVLSQNTFLVTCMTLWVEILSLTSALRISKPLNDLGNFYVLKPWFRSPFHLHYHIIRFKGFAKIIDKTADNQLGTFRLQGHMIIAALSYSVLQRSKLIYKAGIYYVTYNAWMDTSCATLFPHPSFLCPMKPSAKAKALICFCRKAD
jgi:hypothetical protein